MAHKHAELMKQYAEDAANYDEPWKLWEFNIENSFTFCTHHPEWDIRTEYRRKPQVILINEQEVPEPLITKPLCGTEYYYPHFRVSKLYDSYTWRDDEVDNRLFDAGLCHSTIEAAIAHAKALTSFTKREL